MFVLDPYFFAPERAGQMPHRIEYLLGSLRELATTIASLGSRLLVVPGRSVDLVPKVADTLVADRVVAHRWVEPFGRERDRRIKAALGERFVLHEGETLLTPGTLASSSSGGAYKVYGPFARAARAAWKLERPLRAPDALPRLGRRLGLEEVAIPTPQELGIHPNPSLITPGECAARTRLDALAGDRLARYAADRDRLAVPGTTRLSADLKFGTLSIREVVSRLYPLPRSPTAKASADKLFSELLWREFTHHCLWADPELLARPHRAAFEDFPWKNDAARTDAWKAGKTGYPVVDAACRQLLGEGWVHNRARMIAAGFLVKHLLTDYRMGEAHYMRWLVDGDWAQNNFNWQWSAGAGYDAQPVHRVFNPVLQGKKFDPDGDYVRRWVPELAELDAAFIHEPWTAPTEELRRAGVELGKTYPRPIVDHAAARARWLEIASRHLRGR